MRKAELTKRVGALARDLLSRKRRLHRSSEKTFATGNYAAGFAKLLKLAEYGDAADCYWLAACYEQGRGTKRNFGQAIAWYEVAAKQGLVAAMVRLGDMYLSAQRGAGTTGPAGARTPSLAFTIDQPNPELHIQKATYWNGKAAAAGSAEGQAGFAFQYVSGLGVSRDLKTARQLFEQSAAQGHPLGQLGLGLLLAADPGGKQQKEHAIRLLRAAAHQGNVDAKFALARLLVQEAPAARESGDEAADLLLELASGNNTEAMYQLGEIYRIGDKVKQDLKQAETWLKRACTRGHLHAHAALDQLLSMQLSPPHVEEAVAILRQGAELGDPRCQIRLAEIYLTGRGTLVDTTAAAYWLRRAGEQGYVSAPACWEKALYGYGIGQRWFEKPRLRYFDYAIETFWAPPSRNASGDRSEALAGGSMS